jgi:allantoinase
MFHAELPLSEKEEEEEKQKLNTLANDPLKYATFLQSRPRRMENKAIELVTKVCRDYNVRCHIVHLSSSEALPLLKKAKLDGLPLTVETCYHYLFFDAEAIPNAEPKYKCCPPIREKENRDKLWQALKEGTIDMIVSDHSPCTADLKGKVRRFFQFLEYLLCREAEVLWKRGEAFHHCNLGYLYFTQKESAKVFPN